MLTTTKSASRPSLAEREGAASPAPINFDVLFSRCMGNISFAQALLGELESSGVHYADAIVQHATSEETHLVAQAAHSLKGAAAIIGAEPLRAKAAEIEALGHADKTSHLLEMAEDLRREMDCCLEYIPILQADLQRRLSPDY